jgi:hypothetical protein
MFGHNKSVFRVLITLVAVAIIIYGTLANITLTVIDINTNNIYSNCTYSSKILCTDIKFSIFMITSAIFVSPLVLFIANVIPIINLLCVSIICICDSLTNYTYIFLIPVFSTTTREYSWVFGWFSVAISSFSIFLHMVHMFFVANNQRNEYNKNLKNVKHNGQEKIKLIPVE